jgi:hypothetical protein
VRFPVTIRRRANKVKIYAPAGEFAYYRLAYTVAGKRRMQTFAAYSDARQAGERIVRELANGSQAAALSASQSRDALAALERLEAFRQKTGQKLPLLSAVSQHCDAAGKLNGRTVAEAVDGYLGTVVSVKRKDLSEAVEDFILADEPRTKSTNGQRAQLSSEYTRIRALRLRHFAKAPPGHAVCDLTKQHLDAFIKAMSDASPKARNHHRAGLKQFIQWSVRNDYLPPSNNGEVGIYTAKEFRALLDTTQGPLQPLIAIAAFCGLRTAELLRLEWQDIWRCEGTLNSETGNMAV